MRPVERNGGKFWKQKRCKEQLDLRLQRSSLG